MTDPLAEATVRQSVEPTYDHRETGDRYSVQTRVNGRVVSTTPLRDPFIHHQVTVGWRDRLRRKLEVVVVLDADPELVEDVCELDADYAGKHGSTRRSA